MSQENRQEGEMQLFKDKECKYPINEMDFGRLQVGTSLSAGI